VTCADTTCSCWSNRVSYSAATSGRSDRCPRAASNCRNRSSTGDTGESAARSASTRCLRSGGMAAFMSARRRSGCASSRPRNSCTCSATGRGLPSPTTTANSPFAYWMAFSRLVMARARLRPCAVQLLHVLREQPPLILVVMVAARRRSATSTARPAAWRVRSRRADCNWRSIAAGPARGAAAARCRPSAGCARPPRSPRQRRVPSARRARRATPPSSPRCPRAASSQCLSWWPPW